MTDQKPSSHEVNQALAKKRGSEGRTKPFHIGLIADGNRRWAKQRGLPKTLGHKAGVDQLLKVLLPLMAELPEIGMFSIYLLSCDNLTKREKDELNNLFALFERNEKSFLKLAEKYGLIYKHAGAKKGLPESTQALLTRLEKETKLMVKDTNNTAKLTVNLCINYNAECEYDHAFKQYLAEKPIGEKNISMHKIIKHMWMPAVDAVIRTGGNPRFSGFLGNRPCDSNCELLLSQVFLPSLNEDEILKLLMEFATGERRMGA